MVCVIAGKDQLANVVPPSSSGGGGEGRINFWRGGNKILVGGGESTGEGGIFQVRRGDERIFGWWGGSPPIPSQ